MKWYSVKKYKPFLDTPVFVATAYGDIWSARYVESALDSDEPGYMADMDSKLIGSVTHFCIPDLIEIEE